MKILVIEDEDGIRDVLKTMLELQGHEVVEAEDGVVGIERARQTSPDFIFCDVTMPNLDGRGVLAAVKQEPAICEVPFVFLTANADRVDQREGMALGADDYITKPFSQRDILDAIAARTKRHLTVRERIQQLTERHQREANAQWSHELLTPLNAVIGSLDLLEMDADRIDRAELKEVLAIIRQGAERQERMARKLIRYFHLEQERHRAKPSSPGQCPADSVIVSAAAQAAREENRAATLEVAAAPGSVAVSGELLFGAVYELASNALRFSPPTSTVTVTGKVEGVNYRVDVTDQGPGLTAEQRAQIGPFTQFERQKQEQQGLGLGLAIALSTAQFAGGRLVLEPGTGGKGLRASLILPLGPTTKG